jgi:predicted nucleic acid-binding protein
MKIVVDTNIVFSTLLNPHSAIGEILMNIQDEFTFYAPELLKDELKRYSPKIAAHSKLDKNALADIEALVLSGINFVAEENISEQSWALAWSIAKDIDEDDTPFVALAIELGTKLWTGDKVLTRGLIKKEFDIALTTAGLKLLLK